MKIGDKVQVTLYDKEFTGEILKIHRKDGWKGYVNVLLDDKQKIILPVSFMKVVKDDSKKL